MKKHFCVALLVLCALPVYADYQADLTVTKIAPGAPPETTIVGTLHGTKTFVRTDVTKPARVSTVVNLKTHQAWGEMMNMVVDVDLKKQEQDLGPCVLVSDVQECLVKNHFKKIGQETIQGRPCDIYEQTVTKGNQRGKLRIWRAPDVAEVPFLKAQAWDNANEDKRYFETVLANVRIAKQPDGLFARPNNAVNANDLVKALKAKGINIPGLPGAGK